MAASHDVEARLPLTGSSRELDALTDTFNALMASVALAEAQTEAAYTGAIRALAAALDARDPYTAGHSERVSVLSVAIGRALALGRRVEVLRLGALLHDIGKIGVPDDVLRKPGALTRRGVRVIKQHPVLGARICSRCRFSRRISRSSSCTTSGPTAAAIRTACAATTSRWPRASCTSPTPTTR